MLKREDMPAPETLIDYGEDGVEAAMFFYAPDNADLIEIARALGFETSLRFMDDDYRPETLDLRDQYSDGVSGVVARWNPAMPDGWALAAKYDTDDGPFAILIREARPAQEGQGNG